MGLFSIFVNRSKQIKHEITYNFRHHLDFSTTSKLWK